ncbi:hypothetical protein P4L07_26940 [Bacillus cereus]|nr:hypothetical protein [Bacillus cereus]MEC0219290.1 hypothetical protein [Bacillus cereus]MEC3041794.1 hypothetical protein [Bacillus cereus]
MGFLLPKAKSISSIADVQDCGVPSTSRYGTHSLLPNESDCEFSNVF